MGPTVAIDKTATLYDLRVEDMTDPVGLDDKTPTFSWKTASRTLGWQQTAYRILVSDGDEAVWDSGKVEDSASIGIVYSGDALKESTKYRWNVTVWNQKGEVKTSDTATFEIGLFGKASFGDAD